MEYSVRTTDITQTKPGLIPETQNNCIIFISDRMVNAVCSFCDNSYKRNPNVGYYKVTAELRDSLCLKEGADIHTICGEHFREQDISDSGRLNKDARPVFFHRKSTMEHDHDYCDGQNIVIENEGNSNEINCPAWFSSPLLTDMKLRLYTKVYVMQTKIN